MIIERTRLSRIHDVLQLSARIASPYRKGGTPQDLWFRFPAAFESELSTDSDPFVVALLLLAMQNEEAIQVEGPVSAKLLGTLGEYQRQFHAWYPERFKQIDIQVAPKNVVAHAGSGHFAACAFSGGVDSFHSFLTLRGQTLITHALFMAGFDMPLSLPTSITSLTDSFSELMRNSRIQFVAGSTNVREFVNPVDWTNAHGPALAASALFFKSSWNKFYIPSSYLPQSHPKWGSHPDLDPLLSTESLEMVHHGGRLTRVQKLETLVRHPETYSNLRVCWIQDIGLRNCGECEKCVRTMIGLELLGALDRFTTFPPQITPKKIRRLKMRTHQARIFARELIAEAKARKRWDVVRDLWMALARRAVFHRVQVPLQRLMRILQNEYKRRSGGAG